MAPRGQSRRTIDAASLEIEIARLGDLDLKGLRLRWQGVTGRSAPVHLSRHLLFAMLAYRIQADAFGDLDAGMVQILKAAVGSGGSAAVTRLTDKLDRRNQELPPGAILIREWDGRDHRVMVLADGFAFEGKTYDSLPKVALAITGTKWNGSRFFWPADRNWVHGLQ